MTLAGVAELELRGRGETARVEPPLGGLGEADTGAGEVGIVIGRRVQPGSRDRDHQRRATADAGHPVDLPPAEDEVRGAGMPTGTWHYAEGKLVEEPRHKDVRDIGRLLPGSQGNRDSACHHKAR